MSESYEYEVYALDKRYILQHRGHCLLATNDLGVASHYIYGAYKQFGTAMAVWQPRTQGYREYYRDWDDAGDSTKGVMSAISNFVKGIL